MSVQLDEEIKTGTNTSTETNEPSFAHIVDRGDDDRPAQAIVLEARVIGLELTALCGYKFIPQKDPLKLTLCPKCKEMFEFALDFRLGGE